MMNVRGLRLLQVYLGGICASHMVIGLGVNLSKPFMERTADLYGAKADFTPQFLAILHPLGAFMIVLGLLAAVAASDPMRYRAVVYCFVVLFLIRTLQRIAFKQDIEQAFQIDPLRNLLTAGFFLAMAISLAVLQRYVEGQRTVAAG
jgi:hypothetical protein